MFRSRDWLRPLFRNSGTLNSLTSFSLRYGDPSLRAFRLGIEVSPWFKHSEYGQAGENKELRVLFFRIAALLKRPVLPLFVFDGPHTAKDRHPMEKELTSGMKDLAEAFGIEHRTASGDAVVDLALLNAHGVIDGILTDDFEAFLYGAHTVIQNPSSTHRGASNDKGKQEQYLVHRLADLGYNRASLIFISRLCTQTGAFDCHYMEIAVELTRLGFADSLLKAATTMTRAELQAFIPSWRAELIQELASPSNAFSPSLAQFAQFAHVSSFFPNVDMLLTYANPTITVSHDIQWSRREPSLPALASVCERYFEWGWKSEIVKRFRTIIWPSIVIRAMRRYAMAPEQPVFTLGGSFAGSHRVGVDNEWILRITNSKEDPFFNEELLYYVEVDPKMLVHLVEAGVKGTRHPLPEWKAPKEPVDPLSPLKLWLPAVLMREARPDLVQAYEESLTLKARKNEKSRDEDKDEELVPKVRYED
ncbi:PIN domain-like protein [Armillaria novae-zelandiae]|uniref:PIN domain-like protein n=1 Tax=Armillaria novae-zelandiae TaxID=153914 RepID=A0AA39P703_9AGAR|nr:PIN domain-like protein [Armillaria novae-zelandiae]